MTRLKIGIVGGMGTAAGVHFTQKLVELNMSARDDTEHPAFILLSDPLIPSRVDAYLHQTTPPSGAIVSALEQLAVHGADFGVIICNTAHIFLDEISARSPLPVINMIDNAARRSAAMNPHLHAGLLATSATARSGIYHAHFGAKGMCIELPDPEEQKLITEAIFNPMFGIKSSRMTVSGRARQVLADVAARMKQRHGIDHVILGCTELSMAVDEDHLEGLRVIDPVKLLAEACLQRCGFNAGYERAA